MLDDIGFYTMEEERVAGFSNTSPMWRCEIEITDRCNFHCPYCRGLQAKGDMPLEKVCALLDIWKAKNVRFSGGEPTLNKELPRMVEYARKYGRVAVSSNGSQPWEVYKELLACGVTDFSISLDACCSATAATMAGTRGAYVTVLGNIGRLAQTVYTTVGIVVTDDNLQEIQATISLAHSLGVADIRVIPAAQFGKVLSEIVLPQEILAAHPILKYRIGQAKRRIPVRGLSATDAPKCWLVTDDSCVAGDEHYPCVIYMREQGAPIGKVGENMREERIAWRDNHNTHKDKICAGNCLDVCRAFNNEVEKKEKATKK